jgi:hypothetical protein
MSEEKKNLKIEDAINKKLTGDAQKNALDFAGFLCANGLSYEANDDGGGWAVGGIVGDSFGYMLVNGVEEFPGPWTIWLNSCDFESSLTADDKLKEAAWAHTSICGQCHEGWKDCGGGGRTIFGKNFEKLCHSPLMFNNPDASVLENIKKLMLMLKQNKAEEIANNKL